MNIKKIAKLANLKLTKKEELKFQKEMGVILKYIDKLNELKTYNIKAYSNISGLNNIMYDDKETKTLSIPALLIKEAIKSRNGYIVAPKVLKQ
ncbi:MAG: Aspartyl/glutamyl-tRNA(Asn/Gln) amidotransferase subunit C [Parcubacteria group bacterium GW2011_GWA2_31_28]|nr:MAG: Aspartyl/glutamyl-tRNA(Asn/Gln) amidotransferase subunit C [Parcubacteria group bacterium GW2011_GWA2_31_28]